LETATPLKNALKCNILSDINLSIHLLYDANDKRIKINRSFKLCYNYTVVVERSVLNLEIIIS